jgi:hypothetical protein
MHLLETEAGHIARESWRDRRGAAKRPGVGAEAAGRVSAAARPP